MLTFLCLLLLGHPATSEPAQSNSVIRLSGMCLDQTTGRELPVRVYATFPHGKRLLGRSQRVGLYETFNVPLPDSTRTISFEAEGYHTVTTPVHIVGSTANAPTFEVRVKMADLRQSASPAFKGLGFYVTDPTRSAALLQTAKAGSPHSIDFPATLFSRNIQTLRETAEPMDASVRIVSRSGQLLFEEPLTIRPGVVIKLINVASAVPASLTGQGNVAAALPFTRRTLLFDQSQYALTDASRAALDSLARFLTDRPDVVLRITGYTDNVGARNPNVTLSEFRARTVAGYLQQRGARAGQLITAWQGPDAPAAANDTDASRTQNRRVVLELSRQP